MKKIDDYQKYWSEIVIPDYEEHRDNLDDLRRTFHCASSLFHMADWLYLGNKPHFDATLTFIDKNGNAQAVQDEKTFANAVRDFFADFELIRNIANASKHLEIRKGTHAASPVSAANTYVTTTGFGTGGYGSGTYGGAARVRQEAPDNNDIEFSDLSTSIVDMWRRFCAEHGIVLPSPEEEVLANENEETTP